MIGDILQPTHLIFIFVVALLVLGPKRLPEVGRSLGKGIREFRGGMAGIEEQTRGVFDTTRRDAPASDLAHIEPPAVLVRTPTAESVMSVAAAASVPGSESGSAEQDHDDYAD